MDSHSRFVLLLFQPTPPVGAETRPRRTIREVSSYFNPLRPWGRRRGGEGYTGLDCLFQPTPPVGAETGRCDMAPETYTVISTHSARGGGDSRCT